MYLVCVRALNRRGIRGSYLDMPMTYPAVDILNMVRCRTAAMRPIAVSTAAACSTQWRRHGLDWGGHVHPTFARGRS